MKNKFLCFIALVLIFALILPSCGERDKTPTVTQGAEETHPEESGETQGEGESDPDGDESDPDGDESDPDGDESKPDGDESDPDGDESTQGGDESEQGTQSDTEDASGEETETSLISSVEDGKLIESANAHANSVQAYFNGGNRSQYTVKNSEMALTYMRDSAHDQLVSSVSGKGGDYITDTMDVFIKMKGGQTFYASDSMENAQVNLYRFGYYYYEMLLEGQNFIPNDLPVMSTESIGIESYEPNNLKGLEAQKTDEGVFFEVTDAYDPGLVYKGFSFDTAKYNVLYVTAKAVGDCDSLQIFISNNSEGYSAARSVSCSLMTDGEFHTYCVILENIDGYQGNFTGVRIDPRASVGGGLIISEMTVGAAKLRTVPQFVSISRGFHVYSDKMHQVVQFATTKETEGVLEVGIETKIAEDRVSAILIKDAKGEHSSIEDVDWASVECVGFDIDGVGIFGYIMPDDERAGSISVTLADGTYTVIQSRIPENNTLIPSENGTGNANDFYIGSRVYTDANHDFEELLYETYCERNPLDDARIRVSGDGADAGAYLGYDKMRGIYTFSIDSPYGGVYNAYNNPNKHYKVEFALRSDVDRDIYMMTTTDFLMLECAALMNDDMLMLPVPIQVIKNFSETSGDRNLYNLDDPSFSEAIFRLEVEREQKYSYTILNLYQNWGNFPLKQLSSIPYFCPYYHLSTGLTETNCITPWYQTRPLGKTDLNTLPDFRPMSAPFYAGQPQHHNSGSHSWLKYTDSEGKTYSAENVNNTIASHGPTYAEVVMDYISDDGKIAVTYTHMEMPQLDENRTYYTMEYTFLEDLSISDFKHNFMFYEMTDNETTGVYQKIGYLDENNESRVVAANKDADAEPVYVLGDNAPYFSFFEMSGKYDKETNPEGYSSAQGYGNLAFLIYSSEIVIGGERSDASFVIVNAKDKVRLSLDLEEVTFKAGDTIEINAILLPWGSHELNDGIIDEEKGNYEYDMYVDDAQTVQYMDKNVRDVRENSILDPLKASSDTDEIIESVYLPRIRSKDGKTAQFTLSGGENNVSLRVYGFEKLTAPKVEELVGGEWVEYVLSSSKEPDRLGYYHYYDGYSVGYEGDGTFSYSFVVAMNGDGSRTFRISADEDFEGWPYEEEPGAASGPLNVYIDAQKIKSEIDVTDFMFGEAKLVNDEYVSVYIKKDNEKYKESYATFFINSEAKMTGQYFVIKYRVPEDNPETLGSMSLWSHTVGIESSSDDYCNFYPVKDGKWHVEIFDMSSLISDYFIEKDGEYYAQYLRIDFFNTMYYDENTHIDVEYFGIHDDLAEMCELFKDEFDTVPIYFDGETGKVDTATGALKSTGLIDPESGYTRSDAAFGANMGYISGVKQNNFISHTKNGGAQIYSGATVDASCKLFLDGWCAVDGGVEKYVWSVNGLDWFDVTDSHNVSTPESTVMAETAQTYSGKTFGSITQSSVNASFQKDEGISVDLSDYEGETVSVIFAAVPASDTDTLVILYHLLDVVCVPSEEETETETEPEHEDLGEWYYYDDGDPNTNEALEARDCLDCNTEKVETRAAAFFGYFQNITGNGSSNATTGTTDLASKGVSASEDGTLTVLYFMGLTKGTFDKALYRVTDAAGNVSEWIIFAERGNGITSVDEATQNTLTEKGFDGANTGLIKNMSVDLSAYAGQTVTVTLAVISAEAESQGLTDKYVTFATLTNVAVPETAGDTETGECAHESLGEWYYYDDGDASTTEALEARDCLDCNTEKVETRPAAFFGYFQNITGNGSSNATTGTTDLASKGVSASEDGTLTVLYFMGLTKGTFDKALYRVTDAEGNVSEWIIFAERGNGITSVDEATQNTLTEKGFDGANTGLIKNMSVDLSAYAGQTVTVTLAVISAEAESQGLTDKYVTFATLTNVAVPNAD